MKRTVSLVAVATLLSQALFSLVHAASFADVLSDQPYSVAIQALASANVVTGYPDGNFYPAKPVNRAEFLTMLYRARKWTPAAPDKTCFSDVTAGSWYEAVVCDASFRGFVKGYSDSTFKPEQMVNRVEALKMIIMVFGLNAAASDPSISLYTYTDLSLGEWYGTYVNAAFAYHILPIAGQSTTMFMPDAQLLRGEAAAYIYNAMNASLASSSSSMLSSSSSSMSEMSDMSDMSSVSSSGLTINNLTFPFSDNGTFTAKNPVLYRFSLSSQQTIEADTTVDPSASPAGLSCTLFKLAQNGLTYEYYLGFQNSNMCDMRVTLASGNYQLQIQPNEPGVTYTVFTKAMNSDGNDGFVEAKNLVKGMPSSAIMQVGDTGDWYKISLSQDTTMTISLSQGNFKCLVYPMDDVHLSDFSEPVCNTQYDYPPGTYYIGVSPAANHPEKQTYTIQY